MNSPWFNIAVLGLWLTTMTWLVVVKILPSLVPGDPPSHASILTAQAEDRTVAYHVRWEQKDIGWAMIHATRSESGATLIDGRIRFGSLPVRSVIPEVLLKLIGSDDSLPSRLQLDSVSKVRFHANGQLQHFETTLSWDPAAAVIRVDGLMAGDLLVVKIRSAGATHEIRHPLPRNAVLGNALMPQSRLPGLYDGRKWNVEMYSPLRPPTSPFEIIQAEVVGREPITWGGRVENTWLVAYRDDPGGSIGGAGQERAWLWVRDDGVVLQHRIAILHGSVTFVRMTDGERERLQQRLAPARDEHDLGDAESDQARSGNRQAHGESGTEAFQQ